jgi:hypothetical protein
MWRCAGTDPSESHCCRIAKALAAARNSHGRVIKPHLSQKGPVTEAGMTPAISSNLRLNDYEALLPF